MDEKAGAPPAILMERLLTTTEAAELLSVGTSSIKRWADTGELRCVKTAGGHRRFLEHELIRFRDRLDPEPQSQIAEWIDLLLSDGGTHAIEGRLMEERGQAGAWWRVADRVGELIFEMGRRWKAGSLTVMQEHVGTERLHRALARISDSLPLADRSSPVVLLIAAEEDEHTLGLSLAELCAREAGYRTLWSGHRTPLDDVLAMIASRGVQIVGVSASSWSSDSKRLKRLAQKLGQACKQHDVDLILGGSGAWPDALPHAQRVHDFQEFRAALV